MLRALALSALVLFASPAIAGDVGHGYANDEAVLQGTIQAGDCLRLKAYLLKEGAHRVFLASRGGDLGEAMHIGHLIRGLKLSTMIPGKFGNAPIDKRAAMHNVTDKANYTCASACFFVFVAGISRGMDGFEPILGIHRPYIPLNDLGTLTGDQAMAASHGTKTLVEAYMREMDVPTKYVDRMYDVGSDEISWIGEDDFEADLDGVIPDLRDWVKAKADSEAAVMREDIKATDGPTATPQSKAFFQDYLKRLTNPAMRERTIVDALADDTFKKNYESGDIDKIESGICGE